MSAFIDQHVTANGVRTRYWDIGHGGVPLVLLHGLSGTIEDWRGTLIPLSRSRRVIAIDLLGSGDTDKPPHCNYAPDVMRDHVLGVLDALTLEVIDLDGWSLGGRVALDVAYAAPDRVRRLILTAPAGIGADTILDLRAPLLAVLGQAIARPAAAGLRIFSHAFQSGSTTRLMKFSARRLTLAADASSRAAFLGQLRSIVGPSGYLAGPRHELSLKIPHIKTPALLIWGHQDSFAPVSHAAALLSGMPNCSIKIIENCGHAPHIEYPDAYNKAVDDFLS